MFIRLTINICVRVFCTTILYAPAWVHNLANPVEKSVLQSSSQMNSFFPQLKAHCILITGPKSTFSSIKWCGEKCKQQSEHLQRIQES